jgi:membrane-anchored protein YejM (alkaline phosphatase superfamily)
MRIKILSIFLLISVVLFSCLDEPDWHDNRIKKVDRHYKTKNVMIVVVDGLRYSEGWGDSTHQYIPQMAEILSKQGVINTHFYNLGDTYTSAGHTSLTTGIYQSINNSGLELPENPSIFQYWNQQYRNNPVKSWIITSKDKLAVLADCKNQDWKGRFTPSVNSGIDGLGIGSGYREDSLTLKTALGVLKDYHPNLVLINFRDPDYSAHSGIWTSYVDGVRKTDKYVYQLWQFLQSDNIYKNTTTLFVTNDHGRHLDTVADGFASHGDGCEGCRHLGFFASGPDFRKGALINVSREQIDIPLTVAELLGFKLPNSKGKVMFELFGRR